MSAYAEQPPPIKEVRRKKWIRYTCTNPPLVCFIQTQHVVGISRVVDSQVGSVLFNVWVLGDSQEWRISSNNGDVSELEQFYKELNGE